MIILERLCGEFLNRSSFFYDVSGSFFEKMKNFFCFGVFLKGVVYVVGFWNFRKGLCVLMVIIVLFLDVYYFFEVVYYVFFCGYFEIFFD